MNVARTPISISRAVEDAWRGMVAQLFRPFDISRWLALGFTVWLATLGERGFQFNMSEEWFANGAADILAAFWRDHLALSIALIGLTGFLLVATLVLVTWLRSRGTFLFLSNVARGEALVRDPWRNTAVQGNSLFVAALVLGFLFLAAILAALTPLILGVISGAKEPHSMGRAAASGAIAMAVLMFSVVLVFLMIQFVIRVFVEPAMYLHGLRFIEASRVALRAFAARPGRVLLYAIVVLLLHTAGLIAIVLIGFLTCCCGFLLLLIPYIGAVVLLPYYVFFRLLDLHFIRQFGPEWDAWPPPSPIPAPTGDA